ncbi:DUF2141 domain-containing protein [Sandaracinobacteroides saxicola]|uniref:DUF2141 domain-containing protein n=1 Tax=Sandaracinobacteroides saxicola TaxID=2759707 RepID=A0A7G5IKJ4_9SPHN|nr:DUF2141 domain-containing protein [Sandaracinobacteroides saxicola]QMW23886.1 DUF2141 domain-containing protein [Sandaracinobacteroides saxicola]
MKHPPSLLALALLLASVPASACTAPDGGSAVSVTVYGFKDRSGQLRVQLYRALESEFLVSGKYVTRVDTPLTPQGSMTVCATVPVPGTYAVAVLHDRNRNGKLDPFSDGVGFGGNPRLRLGKPAVSKVSLTLPPGHSSLTVQLNYLQGLRIAPVAGGGTP